MTEESKGQFFGLSLCPLECDNFEMKWELSELTENRRIVCRDAKCERWFEHFGPRSLNFSVQSARDGPQGKGTEHRGKRPQ